MTDDTIRRPTPTRRDALKYGTALAASGGLAGCSSIIGGESDDTDSGTGSYTVSMSPMGEVSFADPPETVFTRLTHHADMAFALGRGDSITAMHAPDYYDGLWNQFVARLPGVTLDWTGLYASWKPEKETLYELDSDVHLADPAWIAKQDSWGREDFQEVANRISPWFGNSLSDRHAKPAPGWTAGYEYYGLWEQFEIVAEAFRERRRYEELAAVRSNLLSTIESKRPPESERPSAVMLASFDLDEIYAYTLNNPGFLTAHTRPLGATDAFEGEIETNTVVDFEILLEADPDVIFFLGGFEPGTSLPKRKAAFRSDPVASEITAVRNGRMYPQGARYQGPIMHLFQLEMTAKQLYPEQFGEWPTYEDGPYPKLPAEEQLFDRERVAAAIRGET